MTRKRPIPVCGDLKERMISRVLCYNRFLKRADFVTKTKERLLQWMPPIDRAYFKDEIERLKRQAV